MASPSNKAQIESLAKLIMGHDGLDGLRELVQKRQFDSFRISNPEQREVINSIMDNETLFFGEVKKIADGIEAEKAVNQDDDEKE